MPAVNIIIIFYVHNDLNKMQLCVMFWMTYVFHVNELVIPYLHRINKHYTDEIKS